MSISREKLRVRHWHGPRRRSCYLDLRTSTGFFPFKFIKTKELPASPVANSSCARDPGKYFDSRRLQSASNRMVKSVPDLV